MASILVMYFQNLYNVTPSTSFTLITTLRLYFQSLVFSYISTMRSPLSVILFPVSPAAKIAKLAKRVSMNNLSFRYNELLIALRAHKGDFTYVRSGFTLLTNSITLAAAIFWRYMGDIMFFSSLYSTLSAIKSDSNHEFIIPLCVYELVV
jgi:hypothetical protein